MECRPDPFTLVEKEGSLGESGFRSRACLHDWHCMVPWPRQIMQISRAGVPRCGFETKEPGSGASMSTGNPRPCLQACAAPPALVGWPWAMGGARSWKGSEDFTVQGPKGTGKGGNPGSLPGGSEFLERMGGAESPAGAVGDGSPAPRPAHRWETGTKREALPAAAAGDTASSAPASASPRASAEVLTVGKGPLVRQWTSRRSPRYALQPRSPAVRGGRGVPEVAPTCDPGARGGTHPPPPTRLPSLPRLSPRGAWHSAAA